MTDKDAIRQVLGALTSYARVQLLDPQKGLRTRDLGSLVVEAFNVQRQSMLHEAETAKSHALVDFRMSDADFSALCDFLVDGGGVTDDMTASVNNQSLTMILWQSIHDHDQAVFWKELPHLLKSWVKQRGLIEQLPGGGTVARTTSVVPGNSAGQVGPLSPDLGSFQTK